MSMSSNHVLLVATMMMMIIIIIIKNKWLNRINPLVQIVLLLKGAVKTKKQKNGKCTIGNTAVKSTRKLQIKMLVDFCLNDTLEFNYSGLLMVSYCKLKHLKKKDSLTKCQFHFGKFN